MENYQQKFEKIINENASSYKRPKLLLHSCCAPCSSYALECLLNYFEITVFFYNPNIFPESEMILRAKEQEKLINRINQTLLPYHNQRVIELFKGSYEKEKFYQLTEGLEKEKEKGKRCLICYKLRLEKTALLAKEQGFEYFVTTLTISPLKDAKMINELGYQIQNETQVKWLPSDFKKKNGYQRSLELSKQLGLYRQNYCGCEFSLEKN